jgi:CRISPR-associated protein Cas2
MLVVISYDIVDDVKRRHVSELLLNFGVRVQKSVFECILDDKSYIEVKQRIEEIIDMELDSVRYYFICQGCKARMEVSGKAIFTNEDDIIVF